MPQKFSIRGVMELKTVKIMLIMLVPRQTGVKNIVPLPTIYFCKVPK